MSTQLERDRRHLAAEYKKLAAALKKRDEEKASRSRTRIAHLERRIARRS